MLFTSFKAKKTYRSIYLPLTIYLLCFSNLTKRYSFSLVTDGGVILQYSDREDTDKTTNGLVCLLYSFEKLHAVVWEPFSIEHNAGRGQLNNLY